MSGVALFMFWTSSQLLDGKKIPHWKLQSKCMVYMGASLMYASTVPFVLNPDSGAITAAFHVVFDDWFMMVPVLEGQTLSPELWSHLFGDSHYQNVFDDDNNNYDIVLQDDVEDILCQDFVETTIQNASPASPLPVLPSVATCPVPSDALPPNQWLSLSPDAKIIESFPKDDGHSPLLHHSVQCLLDADFGISRNDLTRMTFHHMGAPPPPHYVMSPSGHPVTFPPMSVYSSPHGPNGTSLRHSSTSRSGKTPALPMLGPHAFKLTTLADLNITLEGGMLSQREL